MPRSMKEFLRQRNQQELEGLVQEVGGVMCTEFDFPCNCLGVKQLGLTVSVLFTCLIFDPGQL